MPVTAAVVQIAINPKMSRISHPMNRLDPWSSLVRNREASPAMGPSSQGHWRFIGNHSSYVEIEESKGIHFLRNRRLKTSI